jgi:aminopeptidase
MLNAYAKLLVDYSLNLQPNERLYIRTTTLAEPLVREIYRAALEVGAIVEIEFEFREQHKIFNQVAHTDAQWEYISPTYQAAISDFEAYLYIIAPFNLRENYTSNGEKTGLRNSALLPFRKRYNDRTASRALKRSLCVYPNQASAQEAGMSLEDYEKFVFQACNLFEPNPVQAWLDLSKNQQHIVDFLNSTQLVRYRGVDTDITFSTQGRTWINSDGQTNMPSGEIYTSPVEDTVNGTIHFSFPTIWAGEEIEGVTLWVKDGYIEKWEAKRGQEILDKIFQLRGARRFGEAAIGNNYNIKRSTKNTLFDEKIGGTIHMAIGQSYFQTGGQNESDIHLDLICDMRQEGEIYADGEKIYEKGRFLLE